MVTPRYAPHLGGVESHVSALAPRIAAAGHTVEVLTQEVGGPDGTPQVLGEGLTVRRFPALGWDTPYTQSPTLWRFLHSEMGTYDLVHAHSYHATPALAVALAGCRRMVFTPHYNGPGHSNSTHLAHLAYRPLGRLITRRARRIICVSRAEADLLVGHFPRARDRITVIPNGVDQEGLNAEAWPSQPPTVLCVGRLEPYKNVGLVIQAMRHLPGEIRLVVVGDGPLRHRLERLAQETGTSQRVTLLGSVPRGILVRWIRTATVQVSMSAHEAFGITVLEALAAGTPVVASDIPAHREFLSKAPAGSLTLVPENATPEVLATALRAAVARGPVGAMAGTNWDAVAELTMQVYFEVAGPWPGADRSPSAAGESSSDLSTGVRHL